MSVAERIRSIVSEAKSEHEEKLRAEQRQAEHLAAELSQESNVGAAWLHAHVWPALSELRQSLAAEGVMVEVQEHMAPRPGAPIHHFSVPTISMRLVAEKASATPEQAPGATTYTFHCDGRYISVSYHGPKGGGPLGLPFNIDSNPKEADEVVFQIIRRAVGEYYEGIREEEE